MAETVKSFNSFELLEDEVRKRTRPRSRIKKILELLEEEEKEEDQSEIQDILQKQKQAFNSLLNEDIEKASSFFSSNSSISPSSSISNQLEKRMKGIEEKLDTLTILSKSQNSEIEERSSSSLNLESSKRSYAEITKQNKDLEHVQEKNKFQKSQKLVLKVQKQAIENLTLTTGYTARNLVNEAFITRGKARKPVVASITKSFRGLTIILTTMPGVSAQFIASNSNIWKEQISEILNSDIELENSENWGKFVVHGIPTSIYNNQEGLELLKREIEDFNPDLELTKTPIWLTQWDIRDRNQAASILVFVKNKEQEKRTHIFIAGLILRIYEYKDKRKEQKLAMQCSNCQKYGHAANYCFRASKCQFCAKKHATKAHSCTICQKQGQACVHTTLKCSNCQENHASNSKNCSFYPRMDTNMGEALDLKRKLDKDGFAIAAITKKTKSSTRISQ